LENFTNFNATQTVLYSYLGLEYFAIRNYYEKLLLLQIITTTYQLEISYYE